MMRIHVNSYLIKRIRVEEMKEENGLRDGNA
jgi:hypothetical protein